MKFNKDFVVIECIGEILSITHYKGTKKVMEHRLDLIALNQKTLFNALMKHNEDLPIILTWKDLRFLRKIGLKI